MAAQKAAQNELLAAPKNILAARDARFVSRLFN